jgi:hypothetical protein
VSGRWVDTALAKLQAAGLWMCDLCVAPSARGDAQRLRHLRTGAACSYLTVPFLVLFALFSRQTFPGPFGDLLCMLYLGGIPVVLGCNLLCRVAGRVEPSVHMGVLYFFGVFGTSAYHLGGPTATTLFWMLVPPIIALFAVGARSAIGWTVAGLAIYAGFLGAHLAGYEFPLEGTPEQ